MTESGSEPGARLRHGDVFANRYVVDRVLGRGSMGEVYAVKDRERACMVALKLPTLQLQQRASVVLRLVRGARAVAELEHPHLVRVYDCAWDEFGVPFVVMERVEGQTLAQLLRARDRLELGLAVEIARQISAAVAALHARRIVHRDLKPANVIVQASGGALTPSIKVLDFGLARLFDRDDSITRFGELLGTLLYLAPERMRACSTRSPESDVYAIGCLLFEMLAGRPPFTARTRAELQLAVRVDRPTDVRTHRADVPAELAQWLFAALEKSPERRPTAAELEHALSGLTLANGPARLPAQERPASLAAGRFRIEAAIGAGAHGEVFSAFDTHERRRVAVKRLRAPSALALQRLKREFRSIGGLDHPNLVGFHALWVEGDDAFISMELVEGRSLLHQLEATPERLIALALQLCAAVSAMHAAGVVHRDLKPAHVLVDREGNVKLIDFSAAASTGSDEPAVGARPYLAPEARRGAVTPAGDLYALGVVLNEAQASCGGACTFPACFARLTSPLPHERPSAAELCAELAAAEPGALTAADVRPLFVGRARELSQLCRAVAAPASLPLLVLVSGAAGIGKSALLERFAQSLAPAALVLRSACRLSEFVPFSAIDAAVDALSEQLQAEPDSFFDEMLPDGVACLLQIFPALRRVAFLQRAARARWVPADAIELQSLAYEGLRQLLQRVGRGRRLVLALDDLHWIDERSSALLDHLLGGADAPRLILVGTRRPDAEAPAPALQRLIEAFSGRVSELELGPLAQQDSADLLRQVCHAGETQEDAAELHRQAAGHPLFLLMLVQRSAAHADRTASGLAAALSARVQALPEASRRLLCAICVCEVPLPLSTLCTATLSEPHAFHALAAGKLARSRGRAGDTAVEPYHAAVREVVVGALDESVRCELHRRIAATLSPAAHGEALIEHLARSGSRHAAVQLAQRLAAEAERELAFERAAQLYSVALSYATEPPSRAALLCAKADAEYRGGSAGDAARCLLAAAQLADGARARALERRAGELLLLCGDAAGGMRLLDAALRAHELAPAVDLADVLQQAAAAYLALRERGLDYAARAAHELSAPAAERLELCMHLAQGLSHVELRALPYAFRALHLALDAGEPVRLQRACAIFVWSTASHFPTELLEPALRLCTELTAALGSPLAHALLHVARAEHLHFAGDILQAEFACESAEQLLLEHCTGVARELAGVRGGATFIQYSQKGDFRSRLPQSLRWMADARRRGDVYHFNMLRAAHALVWIAQDDPGKAEAELAAAEASWPGGVTVFEVSVVLTLDVLDRYQGKPLAHLSPAQGRPSVLQSPAAQTPFLKGWISLHCAWGALGALARDEVAHDEARLLTDALATLRAIGLPIWTHVADALEANRCCLDGDRQRALELLQRSELGFRGLHMLCLAACVRSRRGELSGGALGQRLALEANAQLRELGVARPDRWCRAYFSMFDMSDIDAKTITRG